MKNEMHIEGKIVDTSNTRLRKLDVRNDTGRSLCDILYAFGEGSKVKVVVVREEE